MQVYRHATCVGDNQPPFWKDLKQVLAPLLWGGGGGCGVVWWDMVWCDVVWWDGMWCDGVWGGGIGRVWCGVSVMGCGVV